ncbi:MAG: hypothetical protein SFU91_02315 [Chloroherpetonaceae bacterium]|nr:hypothetical protein [Chloroherpetonaceae bacterium]
MKRIIPFFLFYAFFVGFHCATLYAQQPSVRSDVYPDTVSIGDDITYTLTVLKRPDVSLLYPTKKDTVAFAPLEIRDVQYLPRETRESLVVEKIQYTLAVFDTGMQPIPFLNLTYLTGKDSVSRAIVQAPPSRVYVVSLLDTTRKDIEDIKEIRSLPIPWWVYASIATAVLLFVGMSFWIYRWVRSRKVKEVVEPVIQRSAYEIAVEKIDVLYHSKLESDADLKRFYFELSFIIREFLENHFGILALEQTSYEIYQSIETKVEKAQYNRLYNIFERADMVKFAKYLPSKIEIKESYQEALEFLVRFKPDKTSGASKGSASLNSSFQEESNNSRNPSTVNEER